jgi:hypothetical protein
MNKAKIRLSPKEKELVMNADWILTKNHIIQKTKRLLEMLQEETREHLNTYFLHLPAEVIAIPPKISKGENYKGLPYLVLDYPRLFHKENSFAIRTMFWWGNFFSITLHLSGKYKKQYEQKIAASYSTLKKEKFFTCINDDEWEHHFEKANYVPLSKLSKPGFQKQIRNSSFIKLAQKIPLEQWEDADKMLAGYFKGMIGMLTT